MANFLRIENTIININQITKVERTGFDGTDYQKVRVSSQTHHVVDLPITLDKFHEALRDAQHFNVIYHYMGENPDGL